MASKVFGFFVKKTQSTSNINSPAAAANVPLPSSPTPIVTDLPATTTTKEKEKEKDAVQQLRTPSPSIDSSIARRTSPAPTTANNTSYSAASTRQLSEPLVLPTPVQTEPTQPALLPTSSSLTTLIKTVPPKTLHAYILEQLSSSSSSASPATLEALCAFFNTLTPPPKLHCVRCHKDFTEVENDDRSCLVPHDDESAEVERVGRGGGAGMTMKAMYETLWGCCGRTSEGDGSQGPPEGWCYEGKHTTDVKRARFRADSTPLDDKLTSCLRLNCHGIRDRMPRRGTSTRKRARQTYREASTDEEGSEGESDSGVEEITGKGKEKAQVGPGRKKKAAPRKSKVKVDAHEKEGKEMEDKMDVDQDQLQEGDSSTKTAGSSNAKSPANTVATPTSAPPKRRGRPPKRKVDEDGAESSGTVTPAPKRRGRPPKSKPLIEDSDVETAVSGARKLSLSPVRRPGNLSTSGTPRTRSTSRGRQGQGQGGHVTRLAAEFNKRSESLKRPTPSRSRLGVVVSTSAEQAEDGDVDVDMEESHPTKKKRKVVS